VSHDHKQYERLTFDSFKNRANDGNLSPYEKIGFPDSYRKDKELDIFFDISKKLELEQEKTTIIDIGCGCSDLVKHLIANSKKLNQTLILNDSEEMLSHIEKSDEAIKIAGRFPDNYKCLIQYENQVDAILVYSVLQHIILEANHFTFIDKCLDLLMPEGRLLIGDIPNMTKRNRFFLSSKGQKTHEEYHRGKEVPPLPLTHDFTEKIDDALLFGILHRYRALGHETYLIPQANNLPMATRREDILIVKN
jgi:2-polyprenyl-3-methyl-5-hydroxy-6-metoxy-1,4-benzoquinol methylase